MRSSAWIWVFSSTHSTTAASGGFRYSPATSRTLSTNCGSGDTLYSSMRWGLSPNARHICDTAVCDTPDRRFGHRPRRPVRRVRRGRLQSAHEHVLDHRVGDLARRARPRVVGQPVQAALREPLAPLRHRRGMTAQLRGDVIVRASRRGTQHDPAPQPQRLGRLGPSRPPLQRLSLRVVQVHRRRRPSPSSTHDSLRSMSKTP